MKVEFTEKAWEEFNYWLDTDLDKAERIRELIKDCCRSPHKGIGKPEPLKYELAGNWSRRIDDGNRLVYEVVGGKTDQRIIIKQCRHHYK